ncbi:hypothetical protein VTN02DRAFT_6605 [Thermoascus thermophilus]
MVLVVASSPTVQHAKKPHTRVVGYLGGAFYLVRSVNICQSRGKFSLFSKTPCRRMVASPGTGGSGECNHRRIWLLREETISP